MACPELRALPNVHLVGPQPYASLPGFAKGFSAAMLPFKINRLTDVFDPSPFTTTEPSFESGER